MSYHELQYGKDEQGRFWRDRPLAYLRDNEPDYADALYLQEHWPKKFEIPNYFEHHEYGQGGTLGQANYNVWKEDHADQLGKNWWDLGDSGILVRLDLLTKDQKDVLDKLEDYPLIDDEEHSKLEQEAQTEQWDSWGRSDFKRDLVKLANADDQDALQEMLDAMPDKMFDIFTYELWSSAEQYPEGGDDVRYPEARRLMDRPSWQKEDDPKYIEPWDRTLDDLIRFFDPTSHPEAWQLDVSLSDDAFTEWVGGERTLKIKPKDLPDAVRALAKPGAPGSVTVPYNEEICASRYVVCVWSFIPPADASEATRENPTTHAAADAPPDSALICMGRHIVFELDECDEIELPGRWGMLHDPYGAFWPACSLLFIAFAQGDEKDSSSEGAAYFGRKAHITRGCVDLPPHDVRDGWKEVGFVKQIFYERAGTKAPGRFRHKFNDPRGLMWLYALFKRRVAETPAVLFEYDDGELQALRLELPDGCLVDDRGIALP